MNILSIMRLFRVALAVVVILLAAAPRGAADVPPADAEPCLNKKAGDGCTFEGKSGRCDTKTCTRVTPTGSNDFDCLLCTPTSSSDGGGCSAGSGARPAGAAALLGILTLAPAFLSRRRRPR